MTSVRYSKDHEYVRVEGEEGVVGISHYAQSQLGDIVFVELPELGKVVEPGQEVAVVESVKAASEVYAPVSGAVIAVNAELEGNPALVNTAPEGEGWFLRLKITNPAELDALMDEAAYKAFVASLG
ncbi:glycine cleavage system protein GcvH [Xanthobacter agilis]|uniref:Glycine cleavage system H protein n=1 Tax=Xanthobacter agilis TaxID=47492 RepID=A0ABU0LEC7_XANAG|nr:glycine cleavage system protein GcvH [Xanthobacter agilis]MDQ0505495.1 glycine cleavage system H protein [Xanthobacter agilis]